MADFLNSTGALGALNPASSVHFDTTAGTFRVDGGAAQSGGRLSQDSGQTTMLYDFTTINLGTMVAVSASGNKTAGLLATGNIVVAADVSFPDRSAGPERTDMETSAAAAVAVAVAAAVVGYCFIPMAELSSIPVHWTFAAERTVPKVPLRYPVPMREASAASEAKEDRVAREGVTVVLRSPAVRAGTVEPE